MDDFRMYDYLTRKLRTFFSDRGYIEVSAQSRLSILAACEDPFTISKFKFAGTEWPLPQTGQMWLEHDLLQNPDVPGVFCITTSYRNEPDPIPGRHDLIFQMFEFESRGNFEVLLELEKKLCVHLGFQVPPRITYADACDQYGTLVIEAKHEEYLYDDYGDACILTDFPESTHPFWNMKEKEAGIYNKADVILGGMETIGSAEREVYPVKMLQRFKTISQGRYAGKLHADFGVPEVQKELDRYLSHDFFPRFGGGIGMTRLAKAIKRLEASGTV